MFLGFIIPFKPQSQSNNWKEDNRLLNRTVNCILNQTDDDFKMYVVFTDEPLSRINSSKIQYLQYPFPFEYYEDIKDAEKYFHLFKRELFMARFYDKGKKVTYGSSIAKGDGCQYLMSVDADDLISNKIVEYTKANSDSAKTDGWYLPFGYIWNDGSKILLRQKEMQNFNGSTHILRSDFVNIPDFASTDWSDYSLFAAHGWVKERVKKFFNKTLHPIPFYSVIYVVHESNDSKIKESLSELNFKSFVKKIVRGGLLTKKIQKEFSI